MSTKSQDNDNETNNNPDIDFDTRTIYLYTDVNSQIAKEISRAISHFNQGKYPIYLYINSPGGDVAAMISIMASLKQSQNPIIIDITGEADSAAAFIALCGTYTRMFKLGSMMFHKMWFTHIEGSTTEVEEINKNTQKTMKRIVKEMLKDKKITYAEFMDKMGEKDWTITPEEAKKYGFINEIY